MASKYRETSVFGTASINLVETTGHLAAASVDGFESLRLHRTTFTAGLAGYRQSPESPPERVFAMLMIASSSLPSLATGLFIHQTVGFRFETGQLGVEA